MKRILLLLPLLLVPASVLAEGIDVSATVTPATGLRYMQVHFPYMYLLIASVVGIGAVIYIYNGIKEVLSGAGLGSVMKGVILLISVTIIGYVLAGIL